MVAFTLRLIIAAILVQTVIFGVLAWGEARLLHAERLASRQQAAREHSLLLAQTLALPLAQQQRTYLLNALETLKNQNSLHYAAVFNSQRERVASLGPTPPLTQTLTNELQFSSVVHDDVIAIERPIALGSQTLGIVQMGYRLPVRSGVLLELVTRQAGYLGVAWLLAAVAIGVLCWLLRRELAQLIAAVAAAREGDGRPRLGTGLLGINHALGSAVEALVQRWRNDHNALRQQYQRLSQETRRLNRLLSGLHAVVWEADPGQGRFHYVSAAAQELLGYPRKEWLSPDFCARHVHPSDLDWVQSFLSHPGAATDNIALDFRIYDRRGDCLWLRMISALERREQGAVLTGLLLDVTEEKRTAQRLTYLADHDPLTGLINRRRFQEKLEEQIASSLRYASQGALLFIDLDQFKYINDAHGHHMGDEYLRQVAQHLKANLRQGDILGRLGGDEFGVILPDFEAAQVDSLCETVLKALNNQEFVHADRRTPFAASIGVALFPQQADKANDLLAKADSAMYVAKEQGRNTYRVYAEANDAARLQDKIYWEEQIRRALKENRFRLFFQPIVDLRSGTIKHYESLLRMVGEDGKIIPPGAFIGVAERFGMIREIDHWVVENAIRTQGDSIRRGKSVALTVNLSGRHFGSRDILALIQDATRRHGANPNCIVFEVTETAAVENFADARTFIQALRDSGYRFALDDFGVGFASFDYLKHILVDYIKIDGSFVRNLNREQVDRIFVSAIAEMARDLGVQAIAEFVENREIAETLRTLGVPFGQGYYFGKPAPRFHELDRVVVPENLSKYAEDPARTAGDSALSR